MAELTVSLIVPVLNEASGIVATLSSLQSARQAGVKLLVVDGGSTDGTVDIATSYCDQLVVSPRGRASQMNAGAQAAKGDILLFLHADTRLPVHALESVRQAVQTSPWGHFHVQIMGRSRWLPLIATMMNLRARLTGIATGDQALFVTRDMFWQVGGFSAIPLMEDVELCDRLRKIAWPKVIRSPVTTSGRRWDLNGPWRTIFLMWRIRLAYWLGTSPQKLASRYDAGKSRPEHG